jgi:hypothetical protein
MPHALFTSSSPELLALTDPIHLQVKILENYTDKLNEASSGNERYIISDPHNVFNFLVETFSTVSAEIAIASHHELARQHALRAQTSDDLYRHMSDFDYVNLFSTPCPFIFQLTLDKNHLRLHAEQFNEWYSKAIIPKNTIFTLGKYEFGLHYPIEIRLNKVTGSVTAVFNTEESNPLQTLQTNVIELYEHEYQGQNYVSFLIPVHQFSRSLVREPLISGHGFTKTFKYNNKFYACRLFTEVNGNKIELHQTLTDSIYDPSTPTARLYLEPERNRLKVTIPQIYFSNHKLGNYLTAEVFVTAGKLDLDVTNLTEYKTDVKWNIKDIGPTDPKYSRILERNPHIHLGLSETKLVGGSNGYTYEELRQRVIHNSFHTTVTVTPMDFKFKFQDEGFKVQKHLDNFTKRIYFAYKLLTDKTGSIIHTKHTAMRITNETSRETSTILTNMDQSITILPTTLYQYDPYQEMCLPLTDTQVNYLKLLDKETLVEEMNAHIYTKSPFHIRLITNEKYIRASSYNMLNPTVDKFVFERENFNIPLQMTTAGGKITHLNEGTGGYNIKLLVKKSPDLLNIPEQYITVYVYANSLDGNPVGTTATLMGKYLDQFVYEFNVNTDYWIDEKDGLNTTNLSYDNQLFNHALPLQSKFTVLFLVDDVVAPGVVTDLSMYEGMPADRRVGKVCLIRQNFTITFGENVDDSIYNDIDAQWQGKEYKLHPTDVPLTYDRDIYETDEHGIAKFQIVNGKVKLNLLYAKGDPVLDENHLPILKHQAGDVVIGSNGQPVVLKDRILIYFIHALMVDAKIYASEHPTQIEFRNDITTTLMRYISFLREESKHLLEQTELFFRPVNTLGNANFHIGNDVLIVQPLPGEYRFRCHVPKYVVNDLDMQRTIEDSIVTIIEEAISGNIISLTDIAELIKIKMPEHIKSIDVLGINNRHDLQTMTIMNADSQPSVATKLHINRDGVIAIRKSVNLDFVSE